MVDIPDLSATTAPSKDVIDETIKKPWNQAVAVLSSHCMKRVKYKNSTARMPEQTKTKCNQRISKTQEDIWQKKLHTSEKPNQSHHNKKKDKSKSENEK